MKPLLVITLLLSAMRGADIAPVTSPELTWEMRLHRVQPLAEEGLRLAAILRDDGIDLTLEINIPGKVTRAEKVPNGPSPYLFPLYLQANDANAAAFERLIAAHFGAPRPASFIRNEEYSGAALKSPRRLAEDGGTIFVSDPTGTPFNWSITLKIDPANRRLTLKASETRY